jgi:hypothetical protein
MYKYPNDKQRVTSVIISIYNEIQKKKKKRKKEKAKNRRYVLHLLTYSSAIDMNALERKNREKKKKKKRKNCCLL